MLPRLDSESGFCENLGSGVRPKIILIGSAVLSSPQLLFKLSVQLSLVLYIFAM